jgi:FtsH-binding integral membrane protein
MYAQSSLLKLIKQHTKSGKSIGSNKLSKHVGGAGLSTLIAGREVFLLSVFLTLIFQTCLAFGVMMAVKDKASWQATVKRMFILIFIVQFAIILILAFVPMAPFLKFLLLTVFAIASGMVLSIAASVNSQEVIKAALVGTITIFVLMVVFGTVLSALGIELGWLSGILFIALLALLLIRIVFLFMKTSNNTRRVLAICSLVLFGMFIVYDTNSILQRDYNGDFVTAALDYFLDIINTFVNLLQIVGGDQ